MLWPPPLMLSSSLKRCANRMAADDVVGRCRLEDERGSRGDHAVPDQDRVVPAVVTGTQQRALDLRAELVDLLRRQATRPPSSPATWMVLVVSWLALSPSNAAPLSNLPGTIRLDDSRARRGPAHRGEPLFLVGFFGGVSQRPRHRFSATAQSELGQDAADMVLDRLRADEQPAADLRVGQAVAEEFEHLTLSSCQLTGDMRAWPAAAPSSRNSAAARSAYGRAPSRSKVDKAHRASSRRSRGRSRPGRAPTPAA